VVSQASIRQKIYFNPFEKRDAALAPPLDCTNCESRGTNLPAMSGESPNFWNEVPADTSPPASPGNPFESPEILDSPALCGRAAGAAFNKPFMPGTTAAILLNSGALKRLLAKPSSPYLCRAIFKRLLQSPAAITASRSFFAVRPAQRACARRVRE
jgi:hypothetical protein